MSRQQRRRRANARLGGGEPRATRGERLLRGAQIALGDRAGLEQLLGLFGVPLGRFEVALCRFAVGDGGRAIALLLAVLEAREQLAFRHVVAFADVDADEVTLEARADDGFFDGLEIAGDRRRRPRWCRGRRS